MATLELEGRVALITGAARGIGLGTAKALHSRGASVVLVDLDASETARAAAGVGQRTLAVEGDVTECASLDAAVAAAVERFGRLDVAVANAGISPTARTARVYDEALFERVVDVNLLGVWHTIRACLPEIRERRGHLTLVSSVYAFANGALVSPYAASKAAVEQLGRALRLELAAHGVSVGVAYFGFVDTAMVHVAVREDPLGARFETIVPRPLQKQITPEHAGEVLARGVERRAARTTAPRRWALLSAARGLVGPLVDAGMARHPGVAEILREADAEGRLETRVG